MMTRVEQVATRQSLLINRLMVRLLASRLSWLVDRSAGVALRQAHEPELVEEGLPRYIQRFPGTARRLGIEPEDVRRLGDGASDTVMVRIRLSPGADEHRAEQPVDHGDPGDGSGRG